ncbi:acyltransferase family protein [Citricoccus zhacaiensis]|uniref:acyltransferase family protein n=1 Tax=Citricoccus zhacaiensis TaxID=489142 RepID=UPI001662C782|nr:acyltransferase family protein [Citricoccus zhacaiensis]
MSPGSTAPHPGTRFRSDIQGLRALAVLLVLLYHAGLPFAPGGYVGVDIFFVISGYLITSGLLARIREHGRLDLVDFYGRRVRRILPAALVALTGTVLLTLAILPRSRWDAIATEATGSVLFVVNWILGQGSTDYLRQDEAASPLQHYWSIAVEEQFYLLWPLVLILVLVIAGWRHARQDRPDGGRSRHRAASSLAVLQRQWIVGAAVVLFIGSLVHSLHLTAVNPGMAYFATTTRVHELGMGVLLALFATRLANLPRRWTLSLGWAGLAAMIGAGVSFSGATSFPGVAALVPTLGAAAVIVSGLNAQERVGVGSLLSLRPVTVVGDLSYSLYLWHWPLIVMATFLFGGLPWYIGLMTAALAFLPAWASYRWVEKPFQRWTVVRPPGKAIQVGLAASLAVIVGTASLDIATSRTGPHGWQPPTYAEALDQAAAEQSERGVEDQAGEPDQPVPSGQAAEGDHGTEGSGVGPALLGGELLQADPEAALGRTPLEALLPGADTVDLDLPEAYAQDCVQSDRETDPRACTYGPDDAEFRVALTGDSHAAQWQAAVNRLAAENGWQVRTYLKSSCPLTGGQVLLEGDVFSECEQWNAGVMEELRAGDYDLVLTSSFTYESPEDQRSVPEGHAAAWNALAESGIPVGVIIDPPIPGYNIPECIETRPDTYVQECGFAENEAEPSGSEQQREALERAASAVPLDVVGGICPDGTCPAVIGTVVVWRDKNHLTSTYAESMAPWLGQVLEGQGLVPALR